MEMKQIIFYSLIIILVNLKYTTAQWQQDVRLTNNTAFSGLSNNNARCIASAGDFFHIVWYDDRDGNKEIYYKRSTDGGITWEADRRLTNNSSVSEWPSIFVSNLDVHVIWYDGRDGDTEIYYKRSIDGGASWGADMRLTISADYSFNPTLSISGQAVHVIWYDNRDGNKEIYYKRSNNGGATWGADTRLTNNSEISWDPAVEASDNFVHVVWWDERDGNYEIYYKRSIDGGANWGTDIRLTNNSALSGFVNISVLDSLVFVFWNDERDGNNEIYFKQSSNSGTNWGADTRLTDNAGHSERPSSFISGQSLHVTWEDDRDGNNEIYYKRSTDGGISWEEDTRLTNDPDDSDRPFISVTDSIVGVIWMDNRDGNSEIYYKRNPTGNPTGIKNLNLDIPNDFWLSQNYPNPFNPLTKISFKLAETGFTSLKVYDVLGKEVATLVEEEKPVGVYEVEFDATKLTSGIYFYQLKSGSFIKTKKMIFIK